MHGWCPAVHPFACTPSTRGCRSGLSRRCKTLSGGALALKAMVMGKNRTITSITLEELEVDPNDPFNEGDADGDEQQQSEQADDGSSTRGGASRDTSVRAGSSSLEKVSPAAPTTPGPVSEVRHATTRTLGRGGGETGRRRAHVQCMWVVVTVSPHAVMPPSQCAFFFSTCKPVVRLPHDSRQYIFPVPRL